MIKKTNPITKDKFKGLNNSVRKKISNKPIAKKRNLRLSPSLISTKNIPMKTSAEPASG